MADRERDSSGSRPTAPAPRERGEDSPPGVYRPLPAHPALTEPIGRVALRAPPVPEETQHQQLLKALAATEGKMLSEISDQNSAREAFEEKMRRELRSMVVREVQSIPPPPLPAPLPAPKKGFEWSHLQYIGGFLVALTGLIALILNAQKPSPEEIKHFEAIEQAQTEASRKFEAHLQSDYQYKLDVRSWVTDVFERAASVKIDDPPGTPARDPLSFYPPPKTDPHKITDTHKVQPRDPYPVPPPP